MSVDAVKEEERILQQAKKEELEAEFHTWIQNHFDPAEVSYINEVVSLISDEQFLTIAENWALNTKPNKVFY